MPIADTYISLSGVWEFKIKVPAASVQGRPASSFMPGAFSLYLHLMEVLWVTFIRTPIPFMGLHPHELSLHVLIPLWGSNMNLRDHKHLDHSRQDDTI